MNPETSTTEVKRIDPEWWKYIPFGSNTFEVKKRQEESNLKCKCLPDTWADEPFKICDNFVQDEINDYCANCEHDKACHIEDGTPDEIEFLRNENERLKADLERVTGKPSLNNLIPEIVRSIKSCSISGTKALKLSVLPHDLQATYYGYLRLTWQLQSQIDDYEDKISQLKKLLVSF